jgi:dolichyl-phosphate-mannose-protein mannosyltransferase
MSPRKREPRRRATSKSQQTAAETSIGWSPRDTRLRVDRGEALVIGVLFAAAIALRFSYPARVSIEHWDEAVNASNLFLEDGYPNRFLYSPPLVPTLIEFSMMVFGKTAFAAVMPNLILGSCTIPLCWWVGREWFGPIAGIAAAALAALSDFQIVYSRTGLTDAALGFWFLLAVYCAWRALSRNHVGEAVVAGLAVSCAWTTKYNGWLPLAVALSGFIAWGIFERFDRYEWWTRLPAVAVLVVATLIGWTPVWLWLQADGGYSAVTANHAQYFFGPKGWWDDFKRQLANQQFYEGWLTAAGLILAWLLPVVFQRYRNAQTPGEQPDAGSGPEPPRATSGDLLLETSRRIHLLTVAAVLAGLSLLAGWMGFGPVFTLSFLVFVFFAVFVKRTSEARNAEAARARNLAGWLLAAWFLGLFVAVPLYKPYPRLVMPWLVCAWLAAGAGIEQMLSWVVRRRTARETALSTPPRLGWRNWVLLAGGLGILTVGILSRLNLARTRDIPGWQDRTVRAKIVKQAAQFARKLAPGKPVFLVYGEPALFFDLAIDDYDPQPPLGGDFAFLGPGHKALTQPAFLLAYQGTADFDKLIAPYANALDLVAVFHDTPTDLVLLDTYSPAGLAPGKPRPQEALNLYRIKPR